MRMFIFLVAPIFIEWILYFVSTSLERGEDRTSVFRDFLAPEICMIRDVSITQVNTIRNKHTGITTTVIVFPRTDIVIMSDRV